MGWFLPPLPMSPGNPLVPHQSIHAALLLPAGQAWAITAHMGGGAEAIQPPDPPSMLVEAQLRPAVHGCKGHGSTTSGGWGPREGAPTG